MLFRVDELKAHAAFCIDCSKIWKEGENTEGSRRAAAVIRKVTEKNPDDLSPKDREFRHALVEIKKAIDDT